MSREPAFSLDEFELDALTELVNIAVSRAAASLGAMIGEQILLSVPSIVIIPRAQAAALIADRASNLLVAVRQAFRGEVSGRALLIFPERNSLELVRAIAGEHLTLEDILELEHEALAEIGNVILNASIATIANLFERRLTMSLPEIIRGSGHNFFDLEVSAADDAVLFVHINFSVQGHAIRGYVALVMDLVSLASLKDLLAEFIKRMTDGSRP